MRRKIVKIEIVCLAEQAEIIKARMCIEAAKYGPYAYEILDFDGNVTAKGCADYPCCLDPD
jgi:hypothetical protein